MSYDFICIFLLTVSTLQASSFPSGIEHFSPSSSKGKRKPANGGSHTVHLHMGPRPLPEYRFLPEQPSARSEAYDMASQSHYYDSSIDVPNNRVTSVPSGGKNLHINDQEAPSYTFQGQMSGASLRSQQSRKQKIPSDLMEYGSAARSDSIPSPASDTQFHTNQVVGLENPHISSDRTSRDENISWLGRKRKVLTIV